MYKRFIRWASDRLADDGIVAFITNRAYLDTRQDDGFRQIAAREFSDLYVLDLGSDVRRNPKICRHHCTTSSASKPALPSDSSCVKKPS